MFSVRKPQQDSSSTVYVAPSTTTHSSGSDNNKAAVASSAPAVHRVMLVPSAALQDGPSTSSSSSTEATSSPTEASRLHLCCYPPQGYNVTARETFQGIFTNETLTKVDDKSATSSSFAPWRRGVRQNEAEHWKGERSGLMYNVYRDRREGKTYGGTAASASTATYLFVRPVLDEKGGVSHYTYQPIQGRYLINAVPPLSAAPSASEEAMLRSNPLGEDARISGAHDGDGGGGAGNNDGGNNDEGFVKEEENSDDDEKSKGGAFLRKEKRGRGDTASEDDTPERPSAVTSSSSSALRGDVGNEEEASRAKKHRTQQQHQQQQQAESSSAAAVAAAAPSSDTMPPPALAATAKGSAVAVPSDVDDVCRRVVVKRRGTSVEKKGVLAEVLKTLSDFPKYQKHPQEDVRKEWFRIVTGAVWKKLRGLGCKIDAANVMFP